MTRFSLAIMLLSCLTFNHADAADIEQFLMPGVLIEGHKGLESECTNCHVRLRNTTQNTLCLDCHDHKPIANDIRDKKGFHGKDKKASSLQCKACHSDHKGRDARVIWLDKDRFDHRFTDFDLSGKHKLADCGSCHLEDKKYREAPANCYACHSEDDAHKGDRGKKCEDCHNSAGWGKSAFDHDQTDFKLKFAHTQVNCNACHLGGEYKDTPKKCVSCHAIRDVHADRFGAKCDSCHQESKWSDSNFDHDRDTDFDLEAAHLSAACNDCHSPSYRVSAKKTKVRDCYSCHRDDDPHEGLNGNNCQNCHSVKGWPKAKFDHDVNTDFALKGAHQDLACETCHAIDAKTKEIDTACYSCHKRDDAHQRELGTECDQCHQETAWLQDVRFDHDLTDFPLIGQHSVAGCESCHSTSVFSDAGNQCIDCHAADDVHQQGLGQDCARCHNPNDWLIWFFDHDETDFKLRGTHAKFHCHSCHNQPLKDYDKTNGRCIDCHRRDDIHEGNFGNNCDNCHNQKSFDQVDLKALKRFNKNSSSGSSQ